MNDQHRDILHPASASEEGEGHSAPWGQWLGEAAMPSMLIVSDGPWLLHDTASLQDLSVTLGFRILQETTLAAAAQCLSRIVDVDVVMLRCEGNEPGLDVLLARLDTMAGNQGLHLVIVVAFDGLDHVHAIVGTAHVSILCQPGYDDVAFTLASLRKPGREKGRLHDSGRAAQDDPRLDRLSDEILKLNRTIEALVQNRLPSPVDYMGGEEPEGVLLHSPGRSYSSMAPVEIDPDMTVTASQVRAVLRARRLRENIFPADLFADPAWDILLDLMAARLENTQVSVSSLCIAAAVPPTTALRWIRQLTERGLLERQADPDDGRRIFIALSAAGVNAVQRWFHESHSHRVQALGQRKNAQGRGLSARY